jgi:hypothetical protein
LPLCAVSLSLMEDDITLALLPFPWVA